MDIKPRLRGCKAHGSSSTQIGVRIPVKVLLKIDKLAAEAETSRATVILRLLEAKLEDLQK